MITVGNKISNAAKSKCFEHTRYLVAFKAVWINYRPGYVKQNKPQKNH